MEELNFGRSLRENESGLDRDWHVHIVYVIHLLPLRTVPFTCVTGGIGFKTPELRCHIFEVKCIHESLITRGDIYVF